MKILSIDPSISNTAMVVMELKDGELEPLDYILSQTKKSSKKIPVMQDRFERCKQHFENLKSVLESNKIEKIFFEYPTGSQSASAAVGVGVSVAMCAYLSTLGYETVGFTATSLKKHVNGTNSADKKEIIKYVDEKYPDFLPKKNKKGDINLGKAEHIADAIVITEVARKNGYCKM